MTKSFWLTPWLVATALIRVASSQPLDPITWLAALDKPQLDAAAAIHIEGRELRIGPAVLRLEDGVLVPTVRVAGQIEEAVFIGSGRLLFEPPDPIERGQLELFAKKTRLDEPFEQLVLGGAGLKLEVVFASQTTPATSMPPAAGELLLAWTDGVVRGPKQIAESLVQARLDVAHAGAFCFAALETKELGELLLHVEPNRESPFSLYHYKPLGLSEWEKLRVRHAARRHQRAGRTQDWDLDRLAIWDTWCAATLDDNKTGADPFSGKSYSMDITIEPEGEKVRGTSVMRVAAGATGGRALRLGIHRNLRLSSLRDPSGAQIPFRQLGSSIWAFLPIPLASGAELVLNAEFAGTLFEKTKSKEFRTWETTGWHPRVWAHGFAMSEIELTVRWSPPLQVRVGGKRVDQGDDAGRKWVKHVSPVPALGIFLEVGQFEDFSETRGQRTVTASFSKQNQRWMGKAPRAKFVSEAHEILEWMEREVGPYPHGELSIVLVDHGYAESLPGTIIFGDVALRFSSLALRTQSQDWRVVLAHEIAHQWWGNGIRPERQRDRWLAEGMAEYLSQLYGRRHLLKDREEFYVPATKNWRRALERPSGWGRPVESVGPIVLSDRLSSSRCGDCDDAIVYSKAALALETMGQYIGEDRFLKMLREVVKRSTGTRLSGTTFLSMIAKMANADVDWFRRRYLEGTGFPLVTYTYRIEPVASGGWDVYLSLTQAPRFLYTYKLVKQDDGRFRVADVPVPRVEVGSEPLPLPFVFRVHNPSEPETKVSPLRIPTWRDRANWRLSGRVMLEGEKKTTKIHSDFEVIEVLIDPDGTVLAEVLCETCLPKWVLRRAAVRELEAGRPDEAEALLAQALSAEVDGDPPLTDSGMKVVRRRAADSEDAATHFMSSRVALARGDLTAATAEADKGARLVTEDTAAWVAQERDLQRARIYLTRGEDRKAYLLLWQLMADQECPATEPLLLMAIAADRTNEVEAYAKAMRRAKARHVDVSHLEERRPVPALEKTDRAAADKNGAAGVTCDEMEDEPY